MWLRRRNDDAKAEGMDRVRREYLRGVLARKMAPKGTLRYRWAKCSPLRGGWATARTRY